MILGHRLGFRIGHVDDVVLVDEDTARPAELEPLVHVVALLIENLDTIVVAVTEEQPPTRIHCDGVRNVDLAKLAAFLPPGLDEGAVFRKFHDRRSAVASASPSKSPGRRSRNRASTGTIEPRRTSVSNVKGSSVSPVMSGGAGTSLGPGLPVSQLRLRHLTYGRAGQTARTRMPHARGVAPARRDPPETRRCCASKDENGRVPRTAVGDVAVGNLYAATTVSVRISTPAGTTPVST